MSSENAPTRDRILSATLALLESGAPQATRMSDIAKAARISRQALYLHFPTRAELLVAAVRHVDQLRGVEARLAASRAASTGADRLRLWVEAWGGYIPEIQGLARALIALQDTDTEARAAWADRRGAVHHGCMAVAEALAADDTLRKGLTTQEAADLLAALISVESWLALCAQGGWTQERYIAVMQQTAARALLRKGAAPKPRKKHRRK